MADEPRTVDFDVRPPMPVGEYEQTVKRVNVGYDLLFTLTYCFIRALHRPDLNLLVVGAGGGIEAERFLPGNPGWHITGVDPSQDMLAQAQARIEGLGVARQVTLIRGTVDDLPTDSQYDVATCLFVLHFLSDIDKLALLRGVARRLRPEAPLLAASGIRPDDGGLGEDLLGAWQQYGELMGMPAERMRETIERLMSRPNQTAEGDYVRLIHEAGFGRVARYFSAGGGICAWLAR